MIYNYECLLDLSAKSFLEIRQYNSYQDSENYHFHELIEDYLKNSNFELTKILQAYWKYHLKSGFVIDWPYFQPDHNDFDVLTQVVKHDDSFEFSFEASIALMLHFPSCQQNLSPAAGVLVSHCEVPDYNFTKLNTYDIMQGYFNLLKYVICQEEFPTEWNCMDVISLCLPIIELFDLTIINRLIVSKCLEKGSSHNSCDSIKL